METNDNYRPMKHLLITTIAAVLLVATTAFADPIHTAAWDGDLAGVQAELDKGVDVNAKAFNGWTPLHHAVYKEVVELLIAKGADVNENESGGGTPLDWADRRGRTATVDLLRKHGGKTGEELKAEGK